MALTLRVLGSRAALLEGEQPGAALTPADEELRDFAAAGYAMAWGEDRDGLAPSNSPTLRAG